MLAAGALFLAMPALHAQKPEAENDYQRNEILRTKRNNENCYIPKADGGYYLMQPFVIDFESEDRSKLTEKELRDLKNLGREKLGYITILFAKPLFQKYLKADGQFYQHPACLYLQVHKYIQQWCLDAQKEEDPSAASDQIESAVLDAIDFLYKHGAGDVRKSYITVSLVELLRSCYPAAVDHKNSKYYPRLSIATTVMSAIVSVISNLNSLDYKITDIQEGNDGDSVVKLSHPKRLKTMSDSVSRNRLGGITVLLPKIIQVVFFLRKNTTKQRRSSAYSFFALSTF